MEATTNVKRSKIDEMLALAKARKEAKTAAAASLSPTTSSGSVSREEKYTQITADRERRLREKTEKEAEKAAEKARKESEREAKKPSGKDGGPSHMKKVDKAAAKLPKIDDATKAVLDQVLTAALSTTQRATLAAYILLENRRTQTIEATHSKPLPLGSTVRIVGGDPKYVGLVGKVVHSHKLRAKVEVEGHSKPAYIYAGEATVVEEAQA